jgi:hypothetical protein
MFGMIVRKRLYAVEFQSSGNEPAPNFRESHSTQVSISNTEFVLAQGGPLTRTAYSQPQDFLRPTTHLSHPIPAPTSKAYSEPQVVENIRLKRQQSRPGSATSGTGQEERAPTLPPKTMDNPASFKPQSVINYTEMSFANRYAQMQQEQQQSHPSVSPTNDYSDQTEQASQRSYSVPVQTTETLKSRPPYFHGDINMMEAHKRLAHAGNRPGTFLVRSHDASKLPCSHNIYTTSISPVDFARTRVTEQLILSDRRTFICV